MPLDFNKAVAALGTSGTIIGAISWVANGASETVILLYIAVGAFGAYIGVWPGILLAVAANDLAAEDDPDWILIFPAIGAVAGAIILTVTYDPSEAGSGGRAWGAFLGLLVLGSIVYFFKRSQDAEAAE